MIVWHSAQEKFDALRMPVSCGCWIWLGSTTSLGYGLLHFAGRTELAHRYSFRRSLGPIALGLEIDHLCRNPSCINPEHLEAVSHRENIKRGKRNWEKCPHGDAFRRTDNRTCEVCAKKRRRERERSK